MSLPWLCHGICHAICQRPRVLNNIPFCVFPGTPLSFLYLPIGGAYFGDPQKYNQRFPQKLLVFAGIPEHLIFCMIWQMGGSRCVQTSPTRCGNDLPTLLRNHIPAKNYVWMSLSIDYHMCSPICHFLLCFS